MQRRMSGRGRVFVPVPQECMGRIIGSGGRKIEQIKEETRTEIKTCNRDDSGKESGFLVIGTPSDCGDAKLAIQSRIKKWEDEKVGRKSASPDNFGFRTYSKRKGEDNVRKLDVPKEYIHIVLGSGRKNIERIETKTCTKITVPPRKDQNGDTVPVKIIGQPKDCDQAKARIRQRIAFDKQKTLRHEYGSDEHFVCFAYENENETFRLKPCVSAPKFDDFIQRQRYRIETESDNDDDGDDDGDDDDDDERDISDKAISDIKDHLMTPLTKLKMLKDEKQLSADLWCHFGKAFVSCVDEELIQDRFTPTEIKRKIKNLGSPSTPKNNEKDGHWRVSFEEGIDPKDVNDGQLPKSGDGNHRFFGLKLVHTQWRYDFGFTTPTYRSVRLKVWEGLPPDSDEPPVEVKNILRRVFLQEAEDVNAWLCYPAISILRGEIMTPNAPYDCRIKLRAGSRHVTAKDSICPEEDDILSDYLSNCKLDRASHQMRLPDESEHDIPEDFDCVFYRESKETMYEATVDEESFTVIVLNENGWDSDSSEKRTKEQFGIRVVMNSWSNAMLSPERHWNPEEILQKLENYMKFLSSLQNYLFGDG